MKLIISIVLVAISFLVMLAPDCSEAKISGDVSNSFTPVDEVVGVSSGRVTARDSDRIFHDFSHENGDMDHHCHNCHFGHCGFLPKSVSFLTFECVYRFAKSTSGQYQRLSNHEPFRPPIGFVIS